MSEGKTIKQIADELGVSKQAVHQRIKREPLLSNVHPFTSTIDGVIYIGVDGEKLIKQAFFSHTVNQKINVDGNEVSTLTTSIHEQNQLYEILQNELRAKNEQITSLQNELATERQHSREQADKLAALAETAQRLHAGTIQNQLTDGSTAHPEDEAVPGERGWRFWQRKK